MTMLKRILLLVAALAAAAIALLFVPSVQQAIFDRAAGKLTAKVNTAPLADDALRVAARPTR